MELELKHLAPYQLYKLQIMDLYDDKLSILSGIGKTEHNYKIEIYRKETIIMTRFLTEVKPILRPLTDLSINFYWDNLKDGDFQMTEETIEETKNTALGHRKYYQTLYLFKHHFDVFGLIKEGLAININTL